MKLNIPKTAPGILIAHRGASLDAPENTILAYELAADSGFEWIEVDTQITKDNVAIMMHDPTVERTTNGTGFVCQLTNDELRKLDATRNYPDYSEIPIPTLDEVIKFFLSRDIGLVLEIKPIQGRGIEHGRIIGECVNRLWPQDHDKLVVSSFSSSCLLAFRQINSWVPLAYASEAVVQDPRAYIDMLGVSAFHMNYEFVLKDSLNHILETGAHVAVATVNDPEIARQLIELGAHGVITDTIDLFGNQAITGKSKTTTRTHERKY